MPPLVSVAIPTRNRGARIVPAVESVLANHYPNMELIVVDQSTNEDTRDAVGPFRSDARFRYISSNQRGNGRGRNQALHEATGEILLYTDDDCIVPERWIEVMTRVFDENPRVAVAFCNVDAAPHDTAAGFVPAYRRTKDKLVRTVFQKCRARGIGAGMAVRRRAALAIGGFDEIIGACPDGDIAVRALLSGHHVYETSAVAVLHDGFRKFADGRQLARRNWVAIGAAYAKPLRSGHWRFAIVVAYEGFILALAQPLLRTIVARRPHGLRHFYYFWSGFFGGMSTPLDRKHMLYLEGDQTGPRPAS